ncbi:MAG: hypothetical protein DRJ11_02155 [Candidatus Aminicenantes bacterium]|nr:MAG: hypothetical protein DRJ11_02155 [Candidatus Aminicenantes bacterium]
MNQFNQNSFFKRAFLLVKSERQRHWMVKNRYEPGKRMINIGRGERYGEGEDLTLISSIIVNMNQRKLCLSSEF